jgi:hypothetical protein
MLIVFTCEWVRRLPQAATGPAICLLSTPRVRWSRLCSRTHSLRVECSAGPPRAVQPPLAHPAMRAPCAVRVCVCVCLCVCLVCVSLLPGACSPSGPRALGSGRGQEVGGCWPHMLWATRLSWHGGCPSWLRVAAWHTTGSISGSKPPSSSIQTDRPSQQQRSWKGVAPARQQVFMRCVSVHENVHEGGLEVRECTAPPIRTLQCCEASVLACVLDLLEACHAPCWAVDGQECGTEPCRDAC